MGVSSITDALTLEQLAHNTGYVRPDNCGCLPMNGTCHQDGNDVFQSSLRMDLISSTLNKATCVKLPCVKSTDPGRFLCDFIYCLSLNENKSRSAFIHVPTLEKFTAEEISAAVAAAIKEMYSQIQEMDDMNDVTEIEETVTNQECQEKEPLEKMAAAV